MTKWHVEHRKEGLVITNGDKIDHPLYINGRIFYDFPERLPKYAKELVRKEIRRIWQLI